MGMFIILQTTGLFSVVTSIHENIDAFILLGISEFSIFY